MGAAFNAAVEDSSGLALRGLATVLFEDNCADRPQSKNGKVNLVDFIVRKQRRVVRRIFSAELNGFVGSIEVLFALHVVSHHLYCGTAGSPRQCRSFVGREGTSLRCPACDAKQLMHMTQQGLALDCTLSVSDVGWRKV